MNSARGTASDDAQGPSAGGGAPGAAGPVVGLNIDDLAIGVPRMVRVDGRRICVVRTETGVSAIDNACPHEGYGLVQGSVNGTVITCAWHNWKFDVRDGTCVLGEEAVQAHEVSIKSDGEVHVRLEQRDRATEITERLGSLTVGMERSHLGRIIRETIRLVNLGVTPAELMVLAVRYGAPRSEDGWNHDIAAATDCLSVAINEPGELGMLALVTGLFLIADSCRDRSERSVEDTMAGQTAGQTAGASSDIDELLSHVRSAVEAEDIIVAQQALRTAVSLGCDLKRLRALFIGISGDHLLAYGHGSIYVHKAFELIEMVGIGEAEVILSNLVPTLVYATREDLLPYMRKYRSAIADAEHTLLTDGRLSRPPVETHGAGGDPTWADDGRLREAVLGGRDGDPIAVALDQMGAGATPTDLMDVVIDAISQRMLRYDVTTEDDLDDDFGWLDITHGITTAEAARWAWEADPGIDSLRMCLWAIALAHYTGRHEWHTTIVAIDDHAIATALDEMGLSHEVSAEPTTPAPRTLIRRALDDPSGSPLILAHTIKLSVAASNAHTRSGTLLPIAAAWRFLTARRRDAFIAGNLHRSIARERRMAQPHPE